MCNYLLKRCAKNPYTANTKTVVKVSYYVVQKNEVTCRYKTQIPFKVLSLRLQNTLPAFLPLMALGVECSSALCHLVIQIGYL